MLKARVNAFEGHRVLDQLGVPVDPDPNSSSSRIALFSVVKLCFAVPGEIEFELDQLAALIDSFVVLPSLSTFGEGVSGSKAWISVVDRGFIFHAYFGDDAIDFELYGPFEPDTEIAPRGSSSWICGRMDSDCLKETLRLIDNGRSPAEFVTAHAIEIAPEFED